MKYGINRERRREMERKKEWWKRKRKRSTNRNTLNPREATECMKTTDIHLQYITFKQLTTVLGSPN